LNLGVIPEQLSLKVFRRNEDADPLFSPEEVIELANIARGGFRRAPLELVPVNVGVSTVHCDPHAESAKQQFVVPVQLAPLQRKVSGRNDGKVITRTLSDVTVDLSFRTNLIRSSLSSSPT
jgi:hypothetical protein